MEFIEKMNESLLAAISFRSAEEKVIKCFDLMVEFTNTHGIKQYRKKRCSGKTRSEILNMMMDDLYRQTAPERKKVEARSQKIETSES